MNPQSATSTDSRAQGVGPESNANQIEPFSSGSTPPGGPLPAQATPSRDESDESNDWLTIGQLAADSEQASDITIRSAVIARAPVKDPAEAIAAAEAAWPFTLDELIKRALVRSLRQTAGNRRRTASLLGISRSTLYRMLSRYSIDRVGRTEVLRKRRTGPPVTLP